MATKSSSVENYPGFPDIPDDDLMQKFARHARDAGAVIDEDGGMAIAVKDGRFRITTLSEKEHRKGGHRCNRQITAPFQSSGRGRVSGQGYCRLYDL